MKYICIHFLVRVITITYYDLHYLENIVVFVDFHVFNIYFYVTGRIVTILLFSLPTSFIKITNKVKINLYLFNVI